MAEATGVGVCGHGAAAVQAPCTGYPDSIAHLCDRPAAVRAPCTGYPDLAASPAPPAAPGAPLRPHKPVH
eukprot:693436-Prorocentrum_minimum.AAC.1